MAKRPPKRQIRLQKRLIIAGLRDGMPEDEIRAGLGLPDWTWSRRMTEAIDENAAVLAANGCSCNAHP